MPIIPGYDAQVAAQGSFNAEKLSGAELEPSAGIESLGKSVEEHAQVLQEHANREDVANTAAIHSGIQVNALAEIQQRSAAGTLDVDNLMADYTKQMDDAKTATHTAAGSNFSTKAGGRILANIQKAATIAKANSDAELGLQAHHTVVNNAATAAEMHPGNVPAQYDLVKDSLDGLPEKVRASAATPAYQQVEMGQLNGIMRNGDGGPQQVRDMLKDEKRTTYLSGPQRKELAQAADMRDRGNEADAKRATSNAKEVLEQNQDNEKKNFLKKKAAGTLTDAAILNSKYLSADQQEQYQRINDRTEFHDDGPSIMKLYQDIHASTNDPDSAAKIPQKIDNLLDKGMVTQVTANNLRAELEGKKTPEGIQNKASRDAGVSILKTLAAKDDPDGATNFAQSVAQMDAAIKARQQKGETYQDIMNPNSKDYPPTTILQANRLTAIQKVQKSAAMMTAPKTTTKAGDIVKGYRFKGGDPKDKNNYEKVSP